VEGYVFLEKIVELLSGVSELKTYPDRYLKRLVVDSVIDNGENIAEIVSALQRSLNESFGHHTAFVPFWGFHIEDDISLQFDRYRLCKLGEEGFQREILLPFQQFRAGVEKSQLNDEIKHIMKQYEHIRNVPILAIGYHGASEGAKEFVSTIAQHVAEFLQFAMASSARLREDVKIIDHTGTYFGRFTSCMPVLSRDHENSTPNRLSGPNLRRNPWGPKLTKDVLDDLKDLGAIDLLVDVPRATMI